MVEIMRTAPATAYRTSRELVTAAMQRNRLLSREGFGERLFALAFSGLVYPQIWEDPVVDLAALELGSTSRIVAIASGGCNVMSYLTASPAHVTAVDLNRDHVALNRLKLAAARHLPDHGAFARFFGDANDAANIRAYERWVRPHLCPETLRYWDGRDGFSGRRIDRFAKGFYRYGLLGRFIAAGHILTRLRGVDVSRLLDARSLEEQQAIFDNEIAPLFNSRLVRWLIARPASLFGLGIPPAQYKSLASDDAGGIGAVLRSRLERLACGFAHDQNYFAWQAFGRRYQPDGSRPPYLLAESFATVRAGATRVSVRHSSLTEHLRHSRDASIDAYVLLDAQDWMSDGDLNDLWREITRTAAPGARAIFRTAGSQSILPGRVDAAVLDRWRYEEQRSAELTKLDRSAIYGGFHLYILAE